MIAMAAVNTASNLLYLLSAALAAFLTVGIFAGVFNARRLHIEATGPDSAAREEEIPFRLHVTNPSRFFSIFGIRLEWAAPGTTPIFIPHIPRGSTVSVSAPLTFTRRGRHVLPEVRYITSFPYGLIERIRSYRLDQSLLIYPRLRSVHTDSRTLLPGGRQIRKVSHEAGEEYFCIREYIPGDDIRHIVWRISARLGKYMVRELAADTSRDVILALDCRLPEATEEARNTFEEAVDFTASLAVTLLRRNYRVGLLTEYKYHEPSQGRPHELHLLEVLALIEPLPPTNQKGNDTWLRRLDTVGGSVIFVTADARLWGKVIEGSHALRVTDLRDRFYA